jgi:tetratricopeptide (TPR) repeat protein
VFAKKKKKSKMAAQGEGEASIQATLAGLRSRLAALPADALARLGGGEGPAHRVPILDPPPGFSSRLPALADLMADAAAGPPPLPDPPGPLDDASSNPFLAGLAASTSFHSADALPAMAATFGLDPRADLAGLCLSAAHAPPADLEARRRATFKRAVRRAWAAAETEAGVAAARAGDAERAGRHYAAALALDPAHADALVARGAAAANTRRYGAAIADLEAALAVEPGHANAASYLAAVRARTAALGVGSIVAGALARPPPGLAGAGAVAAAAAAGARASAAGDRQAGVQETQRAAGAVVATGGGGGGGGADTVGGGPAKVDEAGHKRSRRDRSGSRRDRSGSPAKRRKHEKKPNKAKKSTRHKRHRSSGQWRRRSSSHDSGRS